MLYYVKHFKLINTKWHSYLRVELAMDLENGPQLLSAKKLYALLFCMGRLLANILPYFRYSYMFVQSNVRDTIWTSFIHKYLSLIATFSLE